MKNELSGGHGYGWLKSSALQSFSRVWPGPVGSDRVSIEQARTSLDKHRSFDVERSSDAHRSCEAATQKLYLVVSLNLAGDTGEFRN